MSCRGVPGIVGLSSVRPQPVHGVGPAARSSAISLEVTEWLQLITGAVQAERSPLMGCGDAGVDRHGPAASQAAWWAGWLGRLARGCLPVDTIDS